LRLLDGVRPISLERSRIPLTAHTETLLDVDFASESLTEALRRRTDLVPARSEGWVEVTRLRTEEAHLLERAIGEAFLLSRHAIFDAQGELVEHVTSLLDPSHFRLHIQTNSGETPR
jgi:GntR family transcriptional regulator